jgi:RimJ/RimL family protein N-acetyltransferase
VFDKNHAVPDGYRGTRPGALHVRPIRPDDQPALERWFATVSPESRYARFLGFVTELSPRQWSYLTQVDGHNHVAFVAWCDGALAGVARWIRLEEEPEVAEVAFLIGDALQRRGIGTALCAQLVAAARDHGVRRFRAHVLPYNQGIRKLLAAPAFRRVRDSGNVIDVSIRDPSDSGDPTRVTAATRAA